MIDFGTVRPGTTLYIPFATYDSNDPTASVTMTGLATTDIEIYKDGGTTQRGSDNGFALLDTDGIDFDSLTGIHGFSVNLADNSTAGFYAAGSQYWVVVSSITVDSGTISFIAATFRIGYPDAILNTTIATLASQTSFTLTAGPADDNALVGCVVLIHDVASAVQVEMGVCSAYTGSTKTVTLAADPGVFTAAASDNIAFYFPINTRWIGQTAQTGRDMGASVLLSSGTGTGQVTLTSGRVNADLTHIATAAVSTTTAQLGVNIVNAAGTAWGSGAITAASVATGAITNAKFAAGAIDAAAIANGAIDAATFAADVDAEILSYIVDDATRIDASALNTASVTSIPAILTDTGTTLDTLIKDVPTVAEFEARTLAAADYVVVTDTIARVTLVDTTTTNTDMVAAAPSAAAVADAVWDEAIAGHAGAGSTGAALSAASSAGDPWGTAVPGAYGAGTAGNILGNRLVGTIATGTHNPQTGDAYARLGAPAGASVSADVAAVKSDTAAILTDTGTTLDTLIKDIPTVAEFEARTLAAADYTVVSDLGTVQTGDSFARLGAPAGASVSADVAAVKAQTAAIEADTQDLQTQVGTDGAGLTNMPWNAAWDAEVQSECTDALNAYDPPTKAELDTAVANVSVDEIQASALADLFNTDSGTTYAAAVAGSVVAEIADNAGGSSLTAGGIADAVWDEALAGHADAGSAGAALSAAGTAGDPWITSLPGAYGSGTAGNILGNRLVGTIASGTHNAQSGDAYARLGAPAGASISADVAAVKSDTAAILTDTGTTLDTLIKDIPTNSELATALAGADDSVLAILGAPVGASLSADVAAVKAQTAAIEADTQDLQTQIGTDGAGLTNMPWNSAWDAEVQSECTDALNAYDPPTNAEMVARTLVAADYVVVGDTLAAVTTAGSVTAGVTLADDAISASKFDESTAFPLTSVDTGATRVARTGADSDTLETISDQLDQAVLDGVLFLGDTQIA